MTPQRKALYALLGLVAVAAAVLSFSALRDLAIVCGFHPYLAPLLPIVVDAGAAAASIVWLGRAAEEASRGYGRTLALVLLAGSVGGNALGHGLAAYGARPHWLVVVGVSAIAPTVLGALVHLLVLVGRENAAGTGAAETEDVAVEDLPTDPDQRSIDSSAPDHALIADLRSWAADRGRPISRDEAIRAYGIGATRARRLLSLIGWIPRPTDPDREPTGVAS